MTSIQLAIADPCHEDWNKMLPEEKGRFCLSCQKTVVDFTNLSDQQIFDYFKKYKGGNTCGQFTTEQLNRKITQPAKYSLGRWKYFWQMLLPALFALSKGRAQTMKKGETGVIPVCKADAPKSEKLFIGKVAYQPAKQTIWQLDGKVVNDDGEAVPYASVSANETHVVADSAGKFSISILQSALIEISSVGYNTRHFSFDSLKANNISSIEVKNDVTIITANIVLQREEIIIPEVRVTGYEGTRCHYPVGGAISIVRSNLLYSKEIQPASISPALTISPNPIQPGQSFQLTTTVKKAGTYLLRIVNANGIIVTEEKLNLTSLIQTTTINGSALLQKGIYFINLLDPANKKDKGQNGRVVVQ